jgi:hypothetical protein
LLTAATLETWPGDWAGDQNYPKQIKVVLIDARGRHQQGLFAPP